MAETNVDNTLAERGDRYGSFVDHAEITQNIKAICQHDRQKWDALPAYVREGLEMICHKIGRIINGDPLYGDSWHDISGYARLVESAIAMPGQAHNAPDLLTTGPVAVSVAMSPQTPPPIPQATPVLPTAPPPIPAPPPAPAGGPIAAAPPAPPGGPIKR